MPKLNQIVAVLSGKKTAAQQGATAAYNRIRAKIFDGISRTYQPLDDEGEQLPPENKRVQASVHEVFAEYSDAIEDLIDVAMTQDEGNSKARADVVVDGVTVLSGVTVPSLLFLEKRLHDLNTFVEAAPTLSSEDEWTWDTENGLYVSEVAKSSRSKKVPRAHVLYEATPEHPAQVQVFTEDVPVGTWSTKKFSGAISPTEKSEILSRIQKLRDAVKSAREEANSLQVEQVRQARSLLDFVFRA